MPSNTQAKPSTGTPTLNALFISLDRNLLQCKSADALQRHRRYAVQFGHLDIIVLTHKKDGITRTVQERRLAIIPTNSASRWLYIPDALRIAERLFRLRRFNVVSAQDPFVCALIALGIKERWNVPVNIQIHNDYFQNTAWRKESLENSALFHLGIWTLRRADSIRVVSKTIADSVRRFVKGHIPVRVAIVPPSTDFLRKTRYQKKDIDIVAVGRLVKQKDYPTLIRAVSDLKRHFSKLSVRIVGDGQQRSLLKQRISHLHLSKTIVFSGELSHFELAKILSQSRIYVSTSKYEGSSIALLEAMLTGIPVVATRVSGTREMVHHGRIGYLVDPGDASSITKHIKRLLKNPRLRRKMGKKAAERALAVVRQHPEKDWIRLIRETKDLNAPLLMKKANRTHYDSAYREIEKSSADASKIVHYPKFVEWLKQYMRKCENVLDVGGGAGVVVARLREEVGDLKVVGLDISFLMTKLRRSISLHTNIVGDMDQLPIRSNSFDTVVFIASLHHTPNTDRAIQESARVLKPGGMLLLLEHNSFRFLLYPNRSRAIPSPHDPRECLINHVLVTRQLRDAGFILKHSSLHRQLVTLMQIFMRDIPLPLYRLLTAIDEKIGWIPGYREVGSLMMVAAQKR